MDSGYTPTFCRSKQHCNECRRELCLRGEPALIGFYGQTFCSEDCGRRFLKRMHASQDAHACSIFR